MILDYFVCMLQLCMLSDNIKCAGEVATPFLFGIRTRTREYTFFKRGAASRRQPSSLPRAPLELAPSGHQFLPSFSYLKAHLDTLKL